ncbi:UPF0182 family protein [Sedimentibacter sp. zth1]|uniref:UPF0182 family membrane protein n=1 Tax=Sedimentibacter sp. zth1 TaxID=2816908 RepID=UPI001A92667B|nr:UPF0182 family protein [Sedimentibacter sp. zth1]QSX05174.1 UPF0182 family protein [Sedimentibacter sp. zth1]
MKNKSKFGIISISVLLVILLTSFGSILKFITNYLWFNEIGYIKAYLTKIKAELVIGVPLFTILFLIFFFFIKKLMKRNMNSDKMIEITKNKKRANLFIALGSVAISFFFTMGVTSKLWLEILQFFNSQSFNVLDPIFNNDLSFYIFKLPLINTVVGIIINVLFLMIILSVVFNLINGAGKKFKDISQEFTGQGTGGASNIDFSKFANKSTFQRIINQVSFLGFFLLILFGAKIFLSTFDLLYSPRGRVFGAGYTDIAVTLNVYRIMAVLCIISAFTFFYGSRKKNLKIALVVPVVVIAVSIFGSMAAGVVEKFVVEPDQLSKESKYLLNNIKYTQLAYGLDNVEELDFDVDDSLTKEQIENNKEVIENIRINDKAPLNQVYNKLQGIRPYYVFNDVDIDRYYIDGKYKQVYLSSRELDQSLLNDQAKTWINQYLKYTHGYGIALSQVNKVTPQGQPELLIKDIPPVSNTDLEITRPEIYFGEKTNDYVIVNTDENEFDYPAGSDNVETKYEGTAGINLTFMNKLLFSIRQGSYKLLISNNINKESKIVINRNIIKRVQEIAPFLSFENDPYVVINKDDGKLYWIIDGFTMTNRYPYSQPISDSKINYLRNSVKVVVDAYNGDTDFYIVDESDPIVMTYNEIFKELFKPMSEMPDEIKSHIRYSKEMFNIQADLYRTYHMENPTVFFGREDNWDISKQKYMAGEEKVIPNYYMFKLPGEEEIEFLLTIPYTPQAKDNMSAMLVARNDGENYGELLLYKFPKNKTIQGTALIESKIDQDTEISSQLTLWSQKGSNVLRGNTLVIPIQNSLLYVEPIYMQADTQSNFPEMKMVIVAYNDKIVMESTLDKALDKILGSIYSENFNPQEPIVDNGTEDKTIEQLVKQSNTLFVEADNALKSGDWALYGEKINLLENTLKKLNQIIGVDETKTNEEIQENINNEDNTDSEGNE